MTDLAAQTQLEKYQKAAASLDKFLEQATDDQKFDLAKKWLKKNYCLSHWMNQSEKNFRKVDRKKCYHS